MDGAEVSAGFTYGVDLGVLYRGPNLGFGQSSRPSIGVSLANFGSGISYARALSGDSLDANAKDPIPTTLRFGASLDTRLDDFNRVNLALDFNKVLVSRDDDGNYDPVAKALFSSWGSRVVNTSPVAGTCEEFAADSNPDNDNNCRSLSAFRQLTFGAGFEYWYNDLLALRTGYFFEDPSNGNRQFLTAGAGIRYSLIGVDMSYIYALQEDSPVANQLRFSLLLNIPR